MNDPSNYTLRFCRTMKDAGLRGGFTNEPEPSGQKVLAGLGLAIFLTLFLLLALGWTA
jgi:hypothetical protein